MPYCVSIPQPHRGKQKTKRATLHPTPKNKEKVATDTLFTLHHPYASHNIHSSRTPTIPRTPIDTDTASKTAPKTSAGRELRGRTSNTTRQPSPASATPICHMHKRRCSSLFGLWALRTLYAVGRAGVDAFQWRGAAEVMGGMGGPRGGGQLQQRHNHHHHHRGKTCACLHWKAVH